MGSENHQHLKLSLYQVDAFAADLFTGNPAAVCPLSEWLPDNIMQAIANENNLKDPVTGSAYTQLAPYWAGQTGKTALTARQVSTRGGDVRCELANNRVHISGKAVTYLSGTIFLPEIPYVHDRTEEGAQ